MNKIYILSTSYFPSSWSDTLDDIINIDPDKIILVSHTEVNVNAVWGEFLDMLNSYLISTNKTATIITPHLNNTYIRSNIITEKTYSMIESVAPLYREKNYGKLVFDKIYCSYMLRATEGRARLLDSLINNNLMDYGYVTYHQPENKIYPNFLYHNKAPIIFDEEKYSKSNINHFVEPYLYRNSFIDIVGESSTDLEHYFMTEKTIRPICHMKPFITVAPAGYHKKYLRDYIGIKLYDEIINYDFDDESDLQTRINGIIKNLTYFIENSNKLDYYYDLLSPKLEYNKNLLQQIYNDPKKIIPPSLQPILDTTYNYQAYGITYSPMLLLAEKYRKAYG